MYKKTPRVCSTPFYTTRLSYIKLFTDNSGEPLVRHLDICVLFISGLYKIAVCFLWLSLPGHYRVTDEALLAETT